MIARALARERFEPWCAALPAGSVVAMEACSGAHHWGRRLRLLGLDVRLIAGQFCTPYRMQGRGFGHYAGTGGENTPCPEHLA